MSAIGFSPGHKPDVEQLREAYGSLNDITRNIHSAEDCLLRGDLELAGHHLRTAAWHVEQAKQRVSTVGAHLAGTIAVDDPMCTPLPCMACGHVGIEEVTCDCVCHYVAALE